MFGGWKIVGICIIEFKKKMSSMTRRVPLKEHKLKKRERKKEKEEKKERKKKKKSRIRRVQEAEEEIRTKALTQSTVLTAHAPVGPIREQTVVVTRDLARHHERLRHGTEELQTTTPHSIIMHECSWYA